MGQSSKRKNSDKRGRKAEHNAAGEISTPPG